MPDCLFCKIIAGEIPSEKVYEDKEVVAFKDIQPKAPTHLLVVPKKHYPTLNDIPTKELAIVSKVFAVVQKLAKEQGVAKDGYHTIINTNKGGGQAIFHTHWHLLAGKIIKEFA